MVWGVGRKREDHVQSSVSLAASHFRLGRYLFIDDKYSLGHAPSPRRGFFEEIEQKAQAKVMVGSS